MKNKSLIKKIFIVLMLIITSASLSLIGIFMGKIITAISKLSIREFKFSIISLLILVIVNFISSNIAFMLNFKLGKDKFTYLKNEIFKRDIKSKDKINIANYTTNIESLYQNRFMIKINAINLFFTMLFALISIIYINIKMLPIAIIAAGLPLIIPSLFGKKIQEKSTKFNTFYDYYQKYISRTLKIKDEFIRYKVENEIIDEKNKIEDDHEENRRALKSINIVSNIASQSMGSLSFIIVFAFGGYFAFKGEIEVGAIISLVQLMNYLIDPVIALSSLISMYNESKPLYDSIKKLVKKPIENKKPIKLQKPIKLKAENLSFSYGDRKIIDDFNFTFESGGKYLIMANSGKGKSTLAKIISGEINPSKGDIFLNDKNVKSFDFRKYILYIDQNPIIIEDSIENNIKFYRKSGNVDLLNLERNLSEKSNKDSLSGGEKMRISISRSLFETHPINIYDEPTASLDEENTKLIMDKLLSLNETVIIISHKVDKSYIGRFDDIINL